MVRLFRSENNRKIAGVCGGLGEMMAVDPTLIRLAVVVLGLATGIIPFFVGYVLAWWIVPFGRQPEPGSEPTGR
jgi:phage shock protein C